MGMVQFRPLHDGLDKKETINGRIPMQALECDKCRRKAIVSYPPGPDREGYSPNELGKCCCENYPAGIEK